MLRLLRFLFTGDWHLHHWETKKSVEVFTQGNGTGMPDAYEKQCQCSVCGAWRVFKL